MTAAAYITLASILGASKRENRQVKDKTGFIYIFFSETLVTNFLIAMVKCLIFMDKECVKVTIPSLTSGEEA